MRVLFVCTGNTCRSPMCEAYFRMLCERAEFTDVEVFSAGTFAGEGMPVSGGVVEVMKEHNIDVSALRSSQLEMELLDSADLIIPMTGSHKMHIGSMKPSLLKKTKLLKEYDGCTSIDVADPFGGSFDTYMFCFDEMKKALDNLFLEIIQKRENKHSK